MLVGFIGSPCSGKTTTAATLYARLKDCGQPTEYVAEKARWHIAKKKYDLRTWNMEDAFTLTDEDQLNIALAQKEAEEVMNDSGNVIVITDSCVLNSLLYMSPEWRSRRFVQFTAEMAAASYDVIFVCAPVMRPAGIDPNRVHDEAASQLIHEQISSIVMPYLKGREVHLLTGTTDTRATAAFGKVMDCFVGM